MSHNVLVVDGIAWDSPYPGFYHAGPIAYPIMGKEGNWKIITENQNENPPTYGTQYYAMRASRDLMAHDIERMRAKVKEYDGEVDKIKGAGEVKDDAKTQG